MSVPALTDRETAAAVPVAEVRFRAMGTWCHVLVTGPTGPKLLDQAQTRIAQLEQLWSRFLSTSEISQITARAAMSATSVEVEVSAETVSVLERALLGWEATGGTWSPFLGSVIMDLGYDRSFDHGLVSSHPATTAVAHAPVIAERCPLRIADRRRIEIDPGTTLDLGGIAKGFAADLVSAELLDSGAWGAMVNLGGDLRTRGLPPVGIDWVIDVGEAAVDRPRITTVRLPGGGVCTSTTARRRWVAPDGERHHLIDPRTSLPSTEDVRVTTVVAGEAWWAEVAATALTINPELTLPATAALQLYADGTTRRRHDFERYED